MMKCAGYPGRVGIDTNRASWCRTMKSATEFATSRGYPFRPAHRSIAERNRATVHASGAIRSTVAPARMRVSAAATSGVIWSVTAGTRSAV